ncbi:MAG: DUF1643 domain-containing protein [Bacteroidetes bacterium]|nr:DUF1643 domain-containing protein [Bacteroidota bacterium]
MELFDNNGAEFSEGRKYRYVLWRIWDNNKPLIMFIGLNPSKANEEKTDNTITRVKRFAFDWGYGGVYMMNLFAFVSTDPKKLLFRSHEKIGYFNNNYLKQIAEKCDKIIFAWGSFKEAQERSIEIIKMFPEGQALIINSDGSPRHPLYVKANTIPVKFYQFITKHKNK